MGLPLIPLPRDTVEVAGEKVEVRGLSRAEALKISTVYEGDLDAAETYLLSVGAEVPFEEAKEWRYAAPAAEVGRLVDRIVELSGLSPEAGKA